MNEKTLFKKEYTVKKGQEDYRVWSRATDYLFDLMVKKRRARHSIRNLRRPITVRIEVIENGL